MQQTARLVPGRIRAEAGRGTAAWRLWLCLLAAFVLCPLFFRAQAAETRVMEGPDIRVLYSEPFLEPSAREVMARYPFLKESLESIFLWDMDFSPQVLLVGDHGTFVMMAGHEDFVAYALPQKRLVVIDSTRMGARPFTLEMTLKHELCHLLLNHHVTEVHLPRWLEEGICQWVSEGIPEVVLDRRASALPYAAISGTLLPLEAISGSFPRDSRGLALAYEQSRSVVEYIIDSYGTHGVLNILESMKNGIPARDAIRMALLVTPEELEAEWQSDLRSLPVLLALLAGNLYTLLFVLAAVLTVLGYLRFLRRRKRYRLEQEEPEEQGDSAQP